MKKRFLIILIILTLILAFTACNNAQSEYYKLNKLVEGETPYLKLEIVTKTLKGVLNATYTVERQSNQYTVEYSYEKFNQYIKSGDVYVMPAAYKSTVYGNMVVSQGRIISQDGEVINIPIDSLSIQGLSFKQDYFTEASLSKGSFSAKVTDPSSFLGYTITCTDMTVAITYTSKQIELVTIKYISANSTNIELTYILTNTH